LQLDDDKFGDPAAIARPPCGNWSGIRRHRSAGSPLALPMTEKCPEKPL